MTSLSKSLDRAIAAENAAAIQGTTPERPQWLLDFLATPIEDVLSPEALAIVRNGAQS